MKKIIPNHLQKGDTIGFLSISGAIEAPEKIDNVANEFKKLGYKVKISPTTYTKKNYICADDEIRAKSLNDFFADDSIKAIIATRGGYGCIRILDKINYDLIKDNPKIFCGYSDITALQLMIYKKTNMITYNAPMILSDFANGLSEITKTSFWNGLTQNLKEIPLKNKVVYYNGVATGTLWGGNLSTIQSLCGQDFIPNENFIFVTEDINEPIYKIDKMITQLLNIKKFKNNITGIVLGDFSNIDNSKYYNDLFSEIATTLKIPVVSGLCFGHEKDKLTFPIGVNSLLDTRLNKILIK